MSQDDDDRWVEALRGEGGPDRNARAHVEGTLLRSAIRRQRSGQAQSAGEPSEAAWVDRAREDGLIAKAVEEGLIAAPTARGRSSWVAKWRPLAAAAAVGALALGVAWLAQMPRETAPIVRGDEPYRLRAEDPSALKQKLLIELREAGVEAVGYEALGAHGIDADLPRPVSPQVRQVLQAYGIPIPEDGVLRVEIREQR